MLRQARTVEQRQPIAENAQKHIRYKGGLRLSDVDEGKYQRNSRSVSRDWTPRNSMATPSWK